MTQQKIWPAVAVLIATVLVVAGFCVFLYHRDNKYTYPGDTGLGGVTILEEETLQTLPAVFLARGWEFYQYQLLGPEDFAGASPTPDAYVFLGQYGGFELADPSADPHGSATYRLRVLLPETPRSYTLALPEVYSACRVYVNGRLLATRGEPGPGGEYRPEIKAGLLTFQAGEQAEIIVAATDHSHFYSGLVYPPAFGFPEGVLALTARRLILRTVFCFAGLLLGASLLVWGLRRRDRLRGAYGVTCLAFVGATWFPLLNAMGWTGSLLWYRASGLCYSLTFLMALILQGKLCDLPLWARRAGAGAGGAACLAAAFSGLLVRSLEGITFYQYVVRGYKLFVVAFLLASTLRAFFKRHLNPLPQLAGAAALGTCLAMDRIFPMFEPITTNWFPELGVGFLVACLGGAVWTQAAAAERNAAMMEGRIRLAEEQQALQQERFHDLQDEIQEAHRARHDLRHHAALLQELLLADPKGAEAYLAELSGALPAGEAPLCQNLAADCIVRRYLQLARREGISVKAAVDLPEKMPGVSDLDLCVILSNLLENALEALARQSGPQRFLTVTAGVNGNMLAVNVENSCQDSPRLEGGKLRSSKGDRQGVGLASVEAVAKQHDGACWWRAEQGVFRASVTLKLI